MRNNAFMRAGPYRRRWSRDQWQRLAVAVYERRIELGYNSRGALADAAGAGLRTIDSVEMAEGVGRTTLLRIETALRWEHGSCEAILDGGTPTPVALVEQPAEPDMPPDLAAAIKAVEQLEDPRKRDMALYILRATQGPPPSSEEERRGATGR